MSQWNVNALQSPRVFYLREGSTLADVAEKISRLAADDFRAASSFAFLSKSQITFDAAAATPLLQYAAGKPVILFTPGESFSIKTDLIAAAGLSQLENEPVISKVREADLLQLLQEDGGACAFEPHANYHFVTPSLTHSSRFMRIGDLLHDLETLDRLALWLRPYVGNAQAILVDSWSIASAILRTLQINKLDIPFDCLPEHPTHNSIACRRVVERLLSRLPPDGKLVAFVSISGSGKLADQITAMVGESSGDQKRFECLSLYGFINTPKPINCFARVPARESFLQDACELCAKGSIPIHIDPAAYHLKSLRESKVLLSMTHLEPARPFIERYGATPGLFLVHHDDRNDGRHHAFDINMLTLLSHPEFAKRLSQKLNLLGGQVELVVTPNHDPGRMLADAAGKALGCPVIVHDALERSKMSAAEIQAVSSAKKLLIVDDVVNSGSRLKRYIQSIREGQYGSFNVLNYLVAIARPSTPQNLAALSKLLKAGHGWEGAFHAVEEFILPSWNEEQCPWCAEFDFASRIARKFSRPPQWLSERLAKLRNRTDGITDEPLLLLPGVTSVVLGDKSPICPGGTSSMVTMFAVASALQAHRSDGGLEKQLHPGFPVGNVMSPENVKDRYTEGLIRAVLLRLVHRAEWGQLPGNETCDLLVAEVGKENQKIMAGNYGDDVFKNVQSHVMPAVSAQFEGSGRYGQNASFGNAVSTGLTNAYAPYASSMMNQAIDRAPNFQSSQWNNIQGLGDIGKQQQGQAQLETNDALNRYNYNTQLPQLKLNQYMQNVGGNWGNTTTSSQPVYNPSMFSQAAGAGLGLLGLFG